MRIVDEDSAVDDDTGVGVDDDEGGNVGRFTPVGFVVDKTTGGTCRLSDKCGEFTKGFADADSDGFLRR